ncbi:MAG: penicillin acylase family protein [Actinomycetia bacterium]|nr:penicillin acylase family protein [Actinomycetes bacterium]
MSSPFAGPVTIHRDRWGVAHIRTNDALDGFRGQGWAAAHDRLWQMEFDRRRATGRWSEAIGGAGLTTDRLARRLRLADAARADYAALSPAARAMTEAYADGVNEALGSIDALPPEFALTGFVPEPWEPWQSVAVYKIRHFGMGPLNQKLWRAAVLRSVGPDVLARMFTEPGGSLTVPPGGNHEGRRLDDLGLLDPSLAALRDVPVDDHASNNLALAGRHTASGRPIVAGDPHRGLDVPNVYHQNHITTDEFDVIGLSFPGVPGFAHFGHNADVAWCITHGMADDQDLFVETFDDAGRVAGPDGAETPDIRMDTVTVQGADPVEVECVLTDRGAVIAGGTELGAGLALRWTATAAPDTTFEALRPMLSSGSVAELHEAVRPWVVPVNNLITADRSGTIAYRVRGRIAIRPEVNRWAPVPATHGHGWTGFVAYDDLPEVIDPDTGWVATANNRITDDDLYVSMDYAAPSRIDRIGQLLDEGTGRGSLDVDDLVALLGDTFSVTAGPLLEHLFAAPLPESLAGARALLEQWDGRLDTGSAAAALYSTWREKVTDRFSAAHGFDRAGLGGLGSGPPVPDRARALWKAVANRIRVADDSDLPGDLAWPVVLTDALGDAVTDLTNRLGDMAGWSWGAIHRAHFFHQLGVDRPDLADRLPVPDAAIPGDSDTVRCGTVQAAARGRSVAASVARYVFDLADWDRSRWVVPHGVSGDPGSAHHLDQLDRWVDNDLIPMPWTREAVDEATVSRTELGGPDR